ncbi:EAL domain-containing protein [Billgrantia endophytica]|uniref:Diguanylate phosphodiesterase, EAL domain protein n=1 Tax=Billgrantia endophytica TaxID=2033802 RepID=A0A2N7U379_9GAMM|nr:LapD/MoxY N-terminal periplasmic domain-containing protein [Halomonas endophytica]PMR74888.1 Diguanylate phosphodiesterase, EAL domain protein [Halomonas endophytica]
MSLIKQLWLTIVVLLLLAFVGSLLIGVTSSRHYIEQEIRIKNTDNANALALSMSQLEKDPVILELLLAAQFDTGHYQRIELRDTEGETIDRREASEHIDDVPAWFVSLVRFDIPAGQAVVQDGWHQYGTLELESQHSFAYRSLWRSSLELAGWFAIAGVLSLALASWVVRTIRRPLRDVVTQAQAIGERRFTTAREPRTRELREVVQAMNRLSDAVRRMLGEESEKLDQLRRRMQHDPVTDTLTRVPFLDQLQAHLQSDGDDASGTLALVRVGRLAEVNQQLGHAATDALLAKTARTLEQLTLLYGHGQVGRLNGSDFAVIIPRSHDLEATGKELKLRLQVLNDQHGISLLLPSALCEYTQGENQAALLASLDGALAAAESQGEIGQVIVAVPVDSVLYTRHDEWRKALHEALEQGVFLAHYPVLDASGRLIHHEVPSRLRLKGEWRPAGIFLPWVSRLEMTPELDLAVVSAALKDTTSSGQPVGVNLSASSLSNGHFVGELISRVRAHPDAAPRLWFELPQSVALQQPQALQSLCNELLPLGCKMGLEHVSTQFGRIQGLQDLGLSFLKIDAALSHNIEEQTEQQSLLRGMTTLAHSLGIIAIAEGVKTSRAAAVLFELGLDGVTGPGVRHRDEEEEGDTTE